MQRHVEPQGRYAGAAKLRVALSVSQGGAGWHQCAAGKDVVCELLCMCHASAKVPPLLAARETSSESSMASYSFQAACTTGWVSA